MKKIIAFLMVVLIGISVMGCSSKKEEKAVDINIQTSNFETIKKAAKGSTVTFYGYGGNEVMNKWFDSYVIPSMKENYNIDVKRVGMNIDEILNQLISEKQADSKNSNMDVIWINGENFEIAKNNDLLEQVNYEKYPNVVDYINMESPSNSFDFSTPVDGYEIPWGKSELVIAYNSDKINLPKVVTYKDLEKVIMKNKGKCTYVAPPDFEGSAFVRSIMYETVGYETLKNMKLDTESVKKTVQPGMDFLNKIKPYLWKNGENYPATTSQLDNMYSDGEVDFTITYAPNSINTKIKSGEYPKNTKIATLKNGNISNVHYLAISKIAQNKPGAMVLVNFLAGVEAQQSKQDLNNWGDETVIDSGKLKKSVDNKNSEKIKDATTKLLEDFSKRENRETLPELNAKVIPIIEKVWSEEVLNANK